MVSGPPDDGLGAGHERALPAFSAHDRARLLLSCRPSPAMEIVQLYREHRVSVCATARGARGPDPSEDVLSGGLRADRSPRLERCVSARVPVAPDPSYAARYRPHARALRGC